MWLIDFILNVAALLLWLRLQERDVSSIIAEPRISVVATLRRATPKHPRLRILAALLGLLFGRSVFYWLVGPAVHWTAKLYFGPIPLYFRSGFFGRILLYSFLVFLGTLAVYYMALLLVSLVNGALEGDPVQKLVRSQVSWLNRLPIALKLLLPWIGGIIGWCALSPVLQLVGIVPRLKSFAQLVEQAIVLGLGMYLVWKYVLLLLLVLYLLNNYIYFGKWPFWAFIDKTGRRLLAWLNWVPLRVGRFDFAPLVGMVLIFFVAEYSARLLVWGVQRI